MLILNDIHIGFNRKAGTTPASQEALREYLLGSLRHFLDNEKVQTHLLIAGDLFDTFTVSPRDWIDTYSILCSWLERNPKRHLTLMAGNHDWSPKGVQVSSFEMLCRVLRAQYQERVTIIGIDEFLHIENRVWGLAHCSSQDLFLSKLTEVANAEQKPQIIIVHANYDNKFSAQSDHSLNVPRELAANLAESKIQIVFAHEHQSRKDFAGSVYLMGNQWPTSIADCIGNASKHAHVIDEERNIHRIMTWAEDMPPGQFIQVDWTQLETLKTEDVSSFVRVTGSASAAQASEVINAIAAFRRASTCFVISNAVEVDGIVHAEELPETFEVAKRFDVMEYIKKHLTPEEVVAVEALMKDEA
jgi:metallophosphoesterase superfamily enzyme